MAGTTGRGTNMLDRSNEADDLDFWIAVAAGAPVWADTDDPIHPVERMTATIEMLALASCVATLWAGVIVVDDSHSGYNAIAHWPATSALLFMMVRPLRLILGVRRPARLWTSFAARVALVTIAVAGMMPAGFLFASLNLWPLAIALGAEAALCAWALGVRIEPFRWWRSFLLSALHLGVVGAALASASYLGVARSFETVGPIYLLLHFGVLAGAMIAGILDRLQLGVEHERSQAAASAAATEHRQSAHWLHDDVSSEIKLIELRLRADDLAPHDVAAALSDLDHQLRLRQLDELFQSGSVRLAEILQPFVRNAQSHGITITSVPTFDDASEIVDERLGRLFARATSVITTNAILAGADELGFAVDSDSGHVMVSITDNAGGFDLADVPAGRGLWQLGQELGTANIEVSPAGDTLANGSTVTVTLNRLPADRFLTTILRKAARGTTAPG